jgi:hypothetical protein
VILILYFSKKEIYSRFITSIAVLFIFFLPTPKYQIQPVWFSEDEPNYHLQIIPYGYGVIDIFIGTEKHIGLNRHEDHLYHPFLSFKQIITYHRPQLISIVIISLFATAILIRVYFTKIKKPLS